MILSIEDQAFHSISEVVNDYIQRGPNIEGVEVDDVEKVYAVSADVNADGESDILVSCEMCSGADGYNYWNAYFQHENKYTFHNFGFAFDVEQIFQMHRGGRTVLATVYPDGPFMGARGSNAVTLLEFGPEGEPTLEVVRTLDFSVVEDREWLQNQLSDYEGLVQKLTVKQPSLSRTLQADETRKEAVQPQGEADEFLLGDSQPQVETQPIADKEAKSNESEGPAPIRAISQDSRISSWRFSGFLITAGLVLVAVLIYVIARRSRV